MRTATSRHERPGTARRTVTSRQPVGGRGPGRGGTTRAPVRATMRGLAPRKARGQSPVFGILSIASFVLFWVFAVLAFNSLLVAAQNGDGKRLVVSGVSLLLCYLFPIGGGVLGVIGVMKRNSHKIVAGIGLGLNGLLLLIILANMGRH
jgi:hypothetical protein